MNRTSIEWADFTWNPVIGCKHGCPYCYAKRMNDRFKFIPNWEEPQLIEERLKDKVPRMPKKRNRIAQVISPDKPVVFVGSMCDLWGWWVPVGWQKKVIEYIRNNPDTLFIFLTKNPSEYSKVYFQDNPENIIYGLSISELLRAPTWAGVKIIELEGISHLRTLISIEPLLGTVKSDYIQFADYVIVGAQTGPGAVPPKKEWIESIQHPNIHYKDNILKHLK